MSESPAGQKIRVLLVDDHELVRVGVRTLLQAQADIEVVAEAGTGSHALMQARRLRPDVVLLDAHLPDMPGAEVCRILGEIVADAAVAMLTTYSDDDLIRQCVRAGARGYLLKEIPAGDLASSIRALARGESAIDQKVLLQVLALTRQTVQRGEHDQPLSERQRLILSLICDGCSNREIAERVRLSELTVKSYIEDLLKQLGARNRVHAAVMATRRGWL